MNSHFIKIDMSINLVFGQSCDITAKETRDINDTNVGRVIGTFIFIMHKEMLEPELTSENIHLVTSHYHRQLVLN